MMILGIYGTGGLGREVLELTKQINNVQQRWDQILFIDDFRDEKNFHNCQVTSFQELKQIKNHDDIEIIVAVGEPKNRKMLAETLQTEGYKLATLIHPNVYIPASTEIGSGTVICAQAIISCDVVIGKNVYIQPNALVGHNTIIADNTVISGLVHIAGSCYIGHESYIGMNACVKEDIKIGNEAIIGIASVVVRDIPDAVIALGNPARPMKINEDKKVFK